MYRIFAIFLFVQTIPEAFTMPTYLDQHQSAEVRKGNLHTQLSSKCLSLYILYNLAETIFSFCKKKNQILNIGLFFVQPLQ